MALSKGRAGGTMVLNLYQNVEEIPELVRARTEGWQVHRVQTWEDLVEFARKFSRANYGAEATSSLPAPADRSTNR